VWEYFYTCRFRGRLAGAVNGKRDFCLEKLVIESSTELVLEQKSVSQGWFTSPWFHDDPAKGELITIKGRLKSGSSQNSAPFPSAIIIFRPPACDEKIAA
jgi:hypothetical protein